MDYWVPSRCFLKLVLSLALMGLVFHLGILVGTPVSAILNMQSSCKAICAGLRGVWYRPLQESLEINTVPLALYPQSLPVL